MVANFALALFLLAPTLDQNFLQDCFLGTAHKMLLQVLVKFFDKTRGGHTDIFAKAKN